MNATPASPFRCVLDARASLGEGPVWSVREQALYWVDINAPSLNRFDPRSGSNVVMPMPESIGCFALRESGGFIVALRGGVWLARADGALERKLAQAAYDQSTHRFNDGRCDPRGRFFPGSMNELRNAPSGALYRLEPNGTLTEILPSLTVSNGLAWSPDGRTMYHADTPARTIRAFTYDTVSGMPSQPREFHRFEGEAERPDGGAVDSAGNYWSALYRAGKVVKLSPSGDVLDQFDVPAMCPTMCAFGGADLRTLYVTSARQERDAEELARLPFSGGVFAMQVDIPVLPEPLYAG
jgi:sugar lactone lactonase YvrE